MLTKVFLGLTLVGAEAVLYFLIFMSVVSLALVLERWKFFCSAKKGLEEFQTNVRKLLSEGKLSDALGLAHVRREKFNTDLDANLVIALIEAKNAGIQNTEKLGELAQDALLRSKISYDKNLALLATMGNNAPFVGLFGTVLGIIQAFHDLSKQSSSGVSGVTGGISEALVATAIGILVAIPAVGAFNLFQRKVRTHLAKAEALKSFCLGKF